VKEKLPNEMEICHKVGTEETDIETGEVEEYEGSMKEKS
jgi:hypothetical protein